MSEPRTWTISIRARRMLHPHATLDNLEIGAETYVWNFRAKPEGFCAKEEDFLYLVEETEYTALISENAALKEKLDEMTKDYNDAVKTIEKLYDKISGGRI